MTRKWNADATLKKWLRTNAPNNHSTNNSNIILNVKLYNQNDAIPITELENCIVKAAKIVQDLGSDYIDLFERAERELENAKHINNIMERVNLINKNQLSSNFNSNLIEP